MIRLLFFGSDYKAGLTTALSEQILYLAKEPSISLFCVSSENEMETGLHDTLENENVRMSIIPSLDTHDHFLNLSSSLEEIILKEKITHVNVHNNWQLALVAYVKYKHVIPKSFKVIYTIHGYRHNSLVKSICAIGIIGLALFLFADRVISMSGYVSGKFWFIKYKIDEVYYMMNKPEFDKPENKIKAYPLKMVFPAQFRKGKKQELLIKAVAMYIEKTKDKTIQLYLPGKGERLHKCKELVEKNNLSDNVFFLGKVNHKEVIALYEDCNIALAPSNVETYGRCIAEPFALGRCLLTRKTGIALDIINDKTNGFFFSGKNSLVDILTYLHDNPSKVTEIGNNSFNDRCIFSVKNVMSQYLRAINNA